jgi:carboxymethylenebutenolidase
MSGPFVMAAAATFPDRIRSIASIHGANLVTDQPDSAHLMAPKIRCESYFACAEIDKWASPEIVARLEEALKAGGTPYRIEWYPQAQHGFVFPLRAGIYDQPGAERHWERLFDLFGRTLAKA